MKYIVRENSIWADIHSGFTSLEEAIAWGKSNLKGEWAVWKDTFCPSSDPVYKNY